MKFQSKKAQQLSMNFLVKFILGVVLFGMGVVLLWSIFNQATGLAETPQQDIDNRIFALNCDSKQDICVGTNTLTMNPGDKYLLDVKLYNNHDRSLKATALIQLITWNEDMGSQEVVTNEIPGIEILPQNYPDIIVPAKSSTEFSVAIVLSKRAPLGSYVLRIAVDRSDLGLSEKVKRVNLYID